MKKSQWKRNYIILSCQSYKICIRLVYNNLQFKNIFTAFWLIDGWLRLHVGCLVQIVILRFNKKKKGERLLCILPKMRADLWLHESLGPMIFSKPYRQKLVTRYIDKCIKSHDGLHRRISASCNQISARSNLPHWNANR